MKSSQYVIPVPGKFAEGVAFLDLETRKVPIGPTEMSPDGLVMKNGELLRRRWQAFLAGVARDGEIRIVEYEDDEYDFLVAVRGAIGNADTVVYGATRQFDEMILKGRFTNARRAHENLPFFPAMPGASELWWRCIGTAPHDYPRSADVPSREVSRSYVEGRYASVLAHNLRDVCELILAVGDPDAECRSWCLQVLYDLPFAVEEIFTRE